MDFLNPNMLWGLLGIAIPIAIHLLQLKRYKTVYFSDIRFLQQVQQSARKQQRIRHWIILLLRILAWGALTIAFALPFIPSSEGVSSRESIIIYVDTSPSMQRAGQNGPLWTEAKQAANLIVNSYPDYSYHILSPELDGSDAIEVNAAGALQIINRIESSEQSLTWQEVADHVTSYGLQDTALLFMLTDGQAQSIQSFRDTSLPVIWLPYLFEAASAGSNISVDSAWVNSPVALPNQQLEIGFQLRSFNETESQVPVELWINNELRGAKTLNVTAKENAESSFAFSTPQKSPVHAEIRIADESIHFDDTYSLIINLREGLKFLHISSPSLERVPVSEMVLSEDASVNEVPFSNIPFSSLSEFDLVIVDEAEKWPEGLASSLQRAVDNGTSALVFPKGPTSGELALLGISPYGDLDTSRFDNIAINADESFFEGMFYEQPDRVQLPSLKSHYNIANSYERLGGIPLLIRSNGEPSLVRYGKGRGQIYQWNAHLSEHKGTSELYTPLLYQMAIFKGQTSWNSFTLGGNSTTRIRFDNQNSDEAVQLVQDSIKSIPLQRRSGNTVEISTHVAGMHSGPAFIVSGEDTVAAIAYHGNRKESDIESLGLEYVEQLLDSMPIKFQAQNTSTLDEFSAQLGALNGPKSHSSLWIALALLVVLLEMILWRKPKG